MTQPVPPADPAGILQSVVAEAIGVMADVELLVPNPSWSAGVRLRGPAGRVGDLLTSPEWQEARFHEPRVSVFLLSDEIEPALGMLARALREYLQGRYQV